MRRLGAQAGRVPAEVTVKGLGKEPRTQGHHVGPLPRGKPQEGVEKCQALISSGQQSSAFSWPRGASRQGAETLVCPSRLHLWTHGSSCQGETGKPWLKHPTKPAFWLQCPKHIYPMPAPCQRPHGHHPTQSCQQFCRCMRTFPFHRFTNRRQSRCQRH